MKSDAIIKRQHQYALFSGTTDKDNIRILGGQMDANGINYPNYANIIGFVRTRNMLIDGTTFLNIPGYHAIDIADSSSIIIKNCNFLGFIDEKGERDYSEAIQLDPDMANGGSDNKNIIIDNCYFGPNPYSGLKAFPVGIGNHWSEANSYSKNITITNCTFDGMTISGIRIINFLNTKIIGNTFENVVHGVRIDIYGADTAEVSEDILINNNSFRNLEGSALYVKPPKNEKVKHKTISFYGNLINQARKETAIDVKWCTNIAIGNNIANDVNTFVSLRFCDKVLISNNLVNRTTYNAIWIYERFEDEHKGQKQTRDIKVVGNFFNDCGYRGIHLNCKADKVTLQGNNVIDPDRENEGREGIKVDSNPNSVAILNNIIQFTGKATSKRGISVTSGTNIIVKNNCSAGKKGYKIRAEGAIIDITDIGCPENLYRAGIGSVYKRLDGKNNNTLYIKESGKDDTGWESK